MRVLQINSVCGVGSTGRIATDLYKVLEEQGHECLITYGRGTAPEGINSYKIGTNLDNYLHVARTRLLDQHGYGSKKPTIELVKKIKEYNPDVIHLHNLHGYYLNLEVLFNYLAESNKPVVWTLHDCWAFTGHCAYFDYIGCEKWKESCFSCPQKKQYPASVLLDQSKENFKYKNVLFNKIDNMKIITPSCWLKSLVQQSFLSRYPIEVINNGIDLEVFKYKSGSFKERYQITNEFLILGVASIWDRRKGLDYFVELNKRLDRRFKIVLIGIDKKQEKKLPKDIIIIQKTNNVDELSEIYSVADVFVNPTIEDNYPTTNIEAICCNTPVITFNTGGSKETLTTTDYLVSKGDIDQVINIIEKIYSQKKEDKNNPVFVNDSFKRYDKYFLYNQYIKCYEEMILHE